MNQKDLKEYLDFKADQYECPSFIENDPIQIPHRYSKKEDIGIVTAAMWSPTMKRNVALASLRRPYGIKIKDNIFAEIYHPEEIEYRKIWAKCKVVKRQFYSPERRNKVPADLYE